MIELYSTLHSYWDVVWTNYWYIAITCAVIQFFLFAELFSFETNREGLDDGSWIGVMLVVTIASSFGFIWVPTSFTWIAVLMYWSIGTDKTAIEQRSIRKKRYLTWIKPAAYYINNNLEFLPIVLLLGVFFL